MALTLHSVQPEEYIEYFEDYNLRLTQRLAEMGRFEIGSISNRYFYMPHVVQIKYSNKCKYLPPELAKSYRFGISIQDHFVDLE